MEASHRQQHEIDYHRRRAAEFASEASTPVALTRFTSHRYRWWNAYWVILWKARALGLESKSVLVVGGGFGEDAIFLNLFGTPFVCSVDISEDSVKLAHQKSQISHATVCWNVSAAESLPFADQSFDLIYLSDIIHHIEIDHAMREITRVLKHDGLILGNEPYTHSWIQKVRTSRVVASFVYSHMVKYIYKSPPYITNDERKLNENDINKINTIVNVVSKTYFSLLVGRVAPTNGKYVAIFDKLVLSLPCIGYFLAGRVVFVAQVLTDLRNEYRVHVMPAE